jgi:hypothetical protein
MDYRYGSQERKCEDEFSPEWSTFSSAYAYDVGHIHDLSESGCEWLTLLCLESDDMVLMLLFQDGYKIIRLRIDSMGVDGKILDPACRDPNNSHRVSDELLRWHCDSQCLRI